MPKHKRELAARGPAWTWIVNNGPHGPSFAWGQTERAPREVRELDLLRKAVAERAAADPSFAHTVRSAALELLGDGEVEFVRRAIQVLSVVAAAEDVPALRQFLGHRDPDVRKDARACLFELGIHV